MTTKETLYLQIQEAVVAFEEEKVQALARQALEAGFDPLETILKGLSPGMTRVGQLFENHEYFVPEVLMCADALKAGMEVLQPRIPREKVPQKGQVVLGTVQGDVHDIGKNIVKMMLEVGGFTVHDLGKDVPLKRFVEEAARTGAEVVAMSALMTSTMMAMKSAVKMIRERHPAVAVMVGGAPMTREIAEQFGADGYAESAARAVAEAERMIRIAQERRNGRPA